MSGFAKDINQSNTVESTFEKAVELYTSNWDVRNAICQIPILGLAIDNIATTLSQQFQQKRFFQTFDILHETIESIDETKVDKLFLKSEEFYDLLNKCFEFAFRSRHREKIQVYCKILIGAILIENMNYRDSAEDFLLFLSELSLTDIIVAKEIYEQQKNMVPYYQPTDNEFNELKTVIGAGWESLPNICNLDDVEFKISLIKLARCGLIAEVVGVLLGYRGGVYTITPAFKKLMKLIAFVNEPLFGYKLR